MHEGQIIVVAFFVVHKAWFTLFLSEQEKLNNTLFLTVCMHACVCLHVCLFE